MRMTYSWLDITMYLELELLWKHPEERKYGDMVHKNPPRPKRSIDALLF